MSILLNEVSKVVSGKVFFVFVIYKNDGGKMHFSASSLNSSPEKSIFGHFEVIFLKVIVFPGRG